MPTPNPNNPFVADEFYFLNTSEPNFYNQSMIYYIRLVNYTSITAIGVPLSLLLFFLIFKKSPDHLKAYTKMLLLATLIDIYFLLQTSMLQMRSRSISGLILLAFMGPLSSILGYQAYCSFVFLQTIGPPIVVCSLPILYYYRYYTITRNKSPTLLQTIFYFLIGVGLSSLSGYNSILLYCKDPNQNSTGLDVGPLWNNEVPIPPLLVSSSGNTNYILEFLGPPLLVFYYLLALWFGYLTMRALKKQFSSITVNQNVKSMQKQLGKILIFQSLTPLFAIILPRVYFLSTSYLKFNTKYGGDIINLLIAWSPILNMLSTIVFIVPYRRYCSRIFPCSKYYKNSSSVTIFRFNSSQISVQNHPNASITPAATIY